MSKGPTRQKHSIRSTESRRYEHHTKVAPSQDFVLNGHSGSPTFNDLGNRKRSHDRYSKSTHHTNRYSSLSSEEGGTGPRYNSETKKCRKGSISRDSKAGDRHLNFSKSSPTRVSGSSNRAKSPRDSTQLSRKHASATPQNTTGPEQRKSSNGKIESSNSLRCSTTNNELCKHTPVKNNTIRPLSPSMLITSQPTLSRSVQPRTSSTLDQAPFPVSPPSPASSFARNIFDSEVEPRWLSVRNSVPCNDMPRPRQHAACNSLTLIDDNGGGRGGGAYIPDLNPLLPTGTCSHALFPMIPCSAADEDDGMDLASSPPTRSPVASSPQLEAVVTVTPIKQALPSNTNNEVSPQKSAQICKKEGSLTSTCSMSGPSAGIELSKATRAQNLRLQQQRNKLMPVKRITLPPLHLHLSEDGSSPLPPGWQRAPNPVKTVSTDENSSNAATKTYPYYYYHSRTRQTRWDPPVYPWDADPEDQNGCDLNDPEAPYNWQCAHRFAVTHDEIDAMYAQLRSRILEKQCMELLHELAGRPEAPQGAQEQSFAIELYTLVHNELRQFRDARVKLGRIASDEDLYYLTRKLAQCIILKEIHNLHADQAATSSSLFSTFIAEVTPSIRTRASTYIRKYMEAKGSCYRPSSSHHHYQHHQRPNNNNNSQSQATAQQNRPR